MIEIRELIIRASIRDSANTGENAELAEFSEENNSMAGIEENIGQLIKLIKEKNER
ncbi:MAG: hypothetical protein JXB34_10480 [Bacteroidales bacterium]|nr:hypothetical protein [Bacteroidales bacterium]